MMRAILRIQLVLALRNVGTWLALIGPVALAAIASRGGSIGRMFFYFNELAAPFFYLATMLLTVAAAQRERSERVEELVGALPYETAPWVLGRFLAHYLIWLAFSIVAWAAGGLTVWLGGHPLDVSLLAWNWAVIAPVTLAFTTAAALAIGSLVRQQVAAYFLAVVAWVIGPLMMLLLSESSPWSPPPLGEYYASGRYFPMSATGFFYNADLLLYNRLLVLAVAGGALALLLCLNARRRRRPTSRAAVALILSGLLLAGSVAGTVRLWTGRYAAMEAELAVLPEAAAEEEVAPSPVVADRYELAISFAPESHRMAVRGAFDVTNRSDQPLATVSLTLRRNFAVKSLAVDGQSLQVQRDGDHLLLPLALAPGETRRMTAEWEGEVWQWRLQDGPRLAAHVASESIFLPANFGWYPLPGAQALSEQVLRCFGLSCRPTFLDRRAGHPPASFAIAVSGTDLEILHNGDGKTTGLYLVGTPFPVEERHGLLVSVSQANRVQADRAAAEIARLLAAYEAMVPRRQGPVRLVEIHDATYHGTPWLPSAGTGATPNALLLHGLELGRYWDGFFSDVLEETVLGFWWPTVGPTVDQERLYRGFSAFMSYLRTGKDPQSPSPVFSALQQVEKAAGRDAALQVLREMYALLPEGPRFADFEAAVRRASRGQVQVPGALKEERP